MEYEDEEDFDCNAPMLWDQLPTRRDVLETLDALKSTLGSMVAQAQVVKQMIRIWDLALCMPNNYQSVMYFVESVKALDEINPVSDKSEDMNALADVALPPNKRSPGFQNWFYEDQSGPRSLSINEQGDIEGSQGITPPATNVEEFVAAYKGFKGSLDLRLARAREDEQQRRAKEESGKILRQSLQQSHGGRIAAQTSLKLIDVIVKGNPGKKSVLSSDEVILVKSSDTFRVLKDPKFKFITRAEAEMEIWLGLRTPKVIVEKLALPKRKYRFRVMQARTGGVLPALAPRPILPIDLPTHPLPVSQPMQSLLRKGAIDLPTRPLPVSQPMQSLMRKGGPTPYTPVFFKVAQQGNSINVGANAINMGRMQALVPQQGPVQIMSADPLAPPMNLTPLPPHITGGRLPPPAGFLAGKRDSQYKEMFYDIQKKYMANLERTQSLYNENKFLKKQTGSFGTLPSAPNIETERLMALNLKKFLIASTRHKLKDVLTLLKRFQEDQSLYSATYDGQETAIVNIINGVEDAYAETDLLRVEKEKPTATSKRKLEKEEDLEEAGDHDERVVSPPLEPPPLKKSRPDGNDDLIAVKPNVVDSDVATGNQIRALLARMDQVRLLALEKCRELYLKQKLDEKSKITLDGLLTCHLSSWKMRERFSTDEDNDMSKITNQVLDILCDAMGPRKIGYQGGRTSWAQYKSIATAMDTDITQLLKYELASSGADEEDPIDPTTDLSTFYGSEDGGPTYRMKDLELARDKFLVFQRELNEVVDGMALAKELVSVDMKRVTLLAELNTYQTFHILKGGQQRTDPLIERAEATLMRVEKKKYSFNIDDMGRTAFTNLS